MLVIHLGFLDTTSDTASLIMASPIHNKNYYKTVSENKEIIKLMSVLSTTINSAKRVSKDMLAFASIKPQ